MLFRRGGLGNECVVLGKYAVCLSPEMEGVGAKGRSVFYTLSECG